MQPGNYIWGGGPTILLGGGVHELFYLEWGTNFIGEGRFEGIKFDQEGLAK